MKISIIIPVFNENHTIEEIINRVERVKLEKEVIVVDDLSTDGTKQILESLASTRDNITLVSLPRNMGKGAAIRAGLERVTGDVVIIQDADLEYDPSEIPNVVQPIVERKAEIVYGCRFMKGLPKNMPLANRVANILLAMAVRVLFGHPLRDEATCYKAFRADFLRSLNLKCQRFEFCPEVTAKALRRGHRILEVEISHYHPRVRKEGKKIRWTDGVEALRTLVRYRFHE